MTKVKKCGCGLTWNTIHRFDGPCYILDLVEDKIQDIINKQPMTLSQSIDALRELVAIVRTEDKKHGE